MTLVNNQHPSVYTPAVVWDGPPIASTVGSRSKKQLTRNRALILGLIQIATAIWTTIMVCTNYGHGWQSDPIWLGISFGLPGFFVILAGAHPSHGMRVAGLVLSIISILTSLILLYSSVALTSMPTNDNYSSQSDMNRHLTLNTATNSVLIIISLIQGSTSTVTFALISGDICCKSSSGFVVYSIANPAYGQQFVTLQQNAHISPGYQVEQLPAITICGFGQYQRAHLSRSQFIESPPINPPPYENSI